MRGKRGRDKRTLLWFIKATLFGALVWLFALPSFEYADSPYNDFYNVYLNGERIGRMASVPEAYEALRTARRSIAEGSDELVFAASSFDADKGKALFGMLTSTDKAALKMSAILKENVKETLHRAYTVKIGGYAVHLGTSDDVYQLLYAAKDRYDPYGAYDVTLVPDTGREINVLTTEITSNEELNISRELNSGAFPEAGIEAVITETLAFVQPDSEALTFEAFKLGLKDLSFGDKIEIVEGYLPKEEITPLEEAIADVTKENETNQIYEVASGDTLSTIAEKYGLTTQELVDMNPTLTDASSTIRPEDELIVTVPKPLLSVLHTEEEYNEENFEAPVEYVDNDSWYTDETEVIQQPSAGFRKAVSLSSYSNDTLLDREIVKEEIVAAAVPKIVMKGTKIRPTYIKPISGGRFSSGFGRRSRPTKGASSFHRGVDWATPTGTAVKASSAGTVVRAGWGSGYGYCVYINHPDGKQTRYGHLSRVLVKVGDRVNQGDKIALSGNTGVSTGPHLHFEILVGGAQVDPLQYVGR